MIIARPDPRGFVLALRSVYETFAICAPTVVDASLSRMTRQKADVRLSRWAERLMAQGQVDLSVSGLEHVGPGTACVVMSNHQSHYDIPVLFRIWPGTLRMVAKTELFRVPVFGKAMTATGFIEVDRSDRRRAIASMGQARQRLQEGVAVWIAPEGTRSVSGELGPFKKGGFVLAMETGLPIVPVAIAGTRDVLPVHGAAVNTGQRVHVSVGTPIVPPAADGSASTAARDQLVSDVRDAISRLLEDARRRRTLPPAEASAPPPIPGTP